MPLVAELDPFPFFLLAFALPLQCFAVWAYIVRRMKPSGER
jgi:hypothetical protein